MPPDPDPARRSHPGQEVPNPHPAPLASFRKDLKYPILYGVAEILEGTISPREGLHLLMEKYPLRLEEIYPF